MAVGCQLLAVAVFAVVLVVAAIVVVVGALFRGAGKGVG